MFGSLALFITIDVFIFIVMSSIGNATTTALVMHTICQRPAPTQGWGVTTSMMMISIWKVAIFTVKLRGSGMACPFVVAIWRVEDKVVYRQRWSIGVLADHLFTIPPQLLRHSLNCPNVKTSTQLILLCRSISVFLISCVCVHNDFFYFQNALLWRPFRWPAPHWQCSSHHATRVMSKSRIPSVTSTKTYFHIRLLCLSFQSACSCKQ